MGLSINPTDLLALLAAVPLAAVGGESFLRGVLGVGAWLRLPKLLVATTLAAFATSSPELTVSSMAALEGHPEIGLGDALGSNVVNVALIFGLALLFGALRADLVELRRDGILALAVPFLTGVLAFDGTLSRLDGALLLSLLALWLVLILRAAIGHRRAALAVAPPADGVAPMAPARAAGALALGLVCLILAGQLFVTGASGIAATLGVHPFAIGAVIVAIGTSLPELMTMIVARWRGYDEVGLGTLLGSNIFNGLAIVGVAAAIHPIRAPQGGVMLALGFGVLALLWILPRGGLIPRWRGLLLLATYGAFVAATLAAHAHGV